MPDNKAKLIGLVVIALLAVAGTGGVILLNKQEQTSPAATPTASPSNSTQTSQADATESSSSTKSYKNGSYSADGSYRTPGGTETINVDVTLADDKITSVTVTGNGDGDSARYQSQFEEGIAAVVVGKDIDDLQVSRVSGSSLTSTGFNNAIETIKQQAIAA